MSQVLIITIISIVLLLLVAMKLWLDWIYRAKYKQYKQRMSSLLMLNVSHLHDAANFFSLVKSKSDSSDLTGFARGASYHFRSIFDELHKTSTLLEDEQLDGLDLLYQKEILDLKDLLELELLQLGHGERIELENKVEAEHALIQGNFSLLSKLMLNLVENALKYTDKKITIKLSDEAGKWQIRVSSFGKSIPEELVAEINAKNEAKLGHGLSSLQQIMEFHDADLEIDTIAGEGSSIRLIFNKCSSKTKLNKETKSKFNSNLIIQVVVLCSLLLIVSAVIFTSNYNKQICISYYRELVAKYDDQQLELKRELCQEKLNALKADFSFEDQGPFLTDWVDFLEGFDREDQELVSLILYHELLSRAPIAYKNIVDQEAKSLIVEFPNSVDLNLYLSLLNYQQQNFGHMLIHGSRAFWAIIGEKLFLHPQLYCVNNYDAINLLAQLYTGPVKELQTQELIQEPKSFPLSEAAIKEDDLPETIVQINGGAAEIEQEDVLLDLDTLIRQKDEELGLDLDDF